MLKIIQDFLNWLHQVPGFSRLNIIENAAGEGVRVRKKRNNTSGLDLFLVDLGICT
jgi:hypothetical protein